MGRVTHFWHTIRKRWILPPYVIPSVVGRTEVMEFSRSDREAPEERQVPAVPLLTPLDFGRRFVRWVYKLPVLWRRVILVAWDALAWVLGVAALVIIKYDAGLTTPQWYSIAVYLGLAIVFQFVVGMSSQMYLGRNRIGTFDEVASTSALMAAFAVPLGLILTFVLSDLPRGVGFLAPPLVLTFMLASRAIFRILKYSRSRATEFDEAPPALIYGAGEAGHQLAHLIDIAEEPPYRIVGFVDDAPGSRYRRVRNYRVYGTGKDLERVARERGADVIIVAISDANSELLREVSSSADSLQIETVVIPPVREMIGGRVSLAGLRKVNVEDLLGRRPVQTDLREISGYLNGKVVLVTGAGGSIGSELARQVHKLGPSKLVLLDRDESALHEVQLDLYGHGLLDTDDMVLCDIRDYEALKAVFERHRPEVVFHAAALKHLPMLERFPLEGWKTNVLGSANVLRCAQESGVARLVNISTDKAADATSVLGRTKRLAERLTAHYALENNLDYLSVRFGNVLGSRGSVLHSFRAQIERGGPVTVTHPEVTRYFMTIAEACELVLQSGAIGKPGDVLVLDMGEPVLILDVAKRLVTESNQEIEIRFTGLREGEKLHEALFSTLEDSNPSAHPLINQVHVDPISPDGIPEHPMVREEVGELVNGEAIVTASTGRERQSG